MSGLHCFFSRRLFKQLGEENMRISCNGFATLTGFILTSLFIVGCHGGTSPRNNAREGLSTENEEIVTGTLSANYPIPSLADLTTSLQKAGVGYVIDAGSDPSNASRYVTSTSRAVNLGVYGSDLLYASTYGIKTDVSRYLAAVLTLSQELNIHISLLEHLKTLGEAGLDNRDSVQSSITKSIFESYALFCNSNMQEEAVLFLAGGWMESIYLGSTIASLSSTNYDVVELLLKQQEAFNTIRKLLSDHKKTEDGTFVLTLFDEIAPTYEALKESPKNEMKTRALADILESTRTRLLKMGIE